LVLLEEGRCLRLLLGERVRELFNITFEAAAVLNITEEIDHLAASYVAQGVVTPKYEDDARHVAACTVNRIDFLVSWNFRHMVNVQRENAFNGVNLLNGYSYRKPVGNNLWKPRPKHLMLSKSPASGEMQQVAASMP
jgi:hypothetical protein